jgi:DNA invertase Pin-like site-specific DNA recombinase
MPKPGKPHVGKWVEYYRVSTVKQGKSGLGLEAQRQAVDAYLNGGKWVLAAEYTEVESGKRTDNRPQLAAALAACKKLKAKLIVAKLDRLSRNLAFIAALMESGVEFVACDMPVANKLTIHILAAVAEHEREVISQRTKDALAEARKRLAKQGKKLGNPNIAQAAKLGAATNRENADQFAANTRPVIRQIQANGVTSLRGIARVLNARGVPSARGTPWSPVAVSNVIKRSMEGAPRPEF